MPIVSTEGTDAVQPGAPTIHAILSARLDRLGPGQRTIVERAAVVGRDFSLESIAPLLPPSAALHATRYLETLMRRCWSNLIVLPEHVAFGSSMH